MVAKTLVWSHHLWKCGKHVDRILGTRFNGENGGGAWLVVGLENLKGFFQP